MNEYRVMSAYCENKEVFVDARIRVRGKANMTLLPDFFLVEVYNMEAEDMALIENRRKLKICTKDSTVLCSGDVEDIYNSYDGTNRISSIALSDGQSFWETKVSKAVGAGASFSGTLAYIMKNAFMGSYLAEDRRFIRAQTISGRLADAVAEIARSVHARAFISNNVVHVCEKGKSEIIVTINEDDILEDPNDADGVCLLKADVKGWPVGMLHEFRKKRYRLVSQGIDADNFEGNWQTELTLVDESFLDSDGMDGG